MPGAEGMVLLPALERVRSRLCAWPPSFAYVLLIVAVAVAYFLTGRLGQIFAIVGGQVTPVWPPSGIALAAFLLFGRRVWPGVWLGAFAVNFSGLLLTPGLLRLVASSAAAAGMASGAVLAAWLGYGLLRRYAGSGNPLDRLRGVGVLLGLSGMVGSLVSASNGTAWLVFFGFAPEGALGNIWFTWWLGDAAGVFIFAPLMLAWCGLPWFRPRVRAWEAGLCFGLLLVVSWDVFIVGTIPFSFILIPFLVWPALRFGQRGATAAILLISGIAVWGTLHGGGPFHLSSLNASLLVLESFLAIATLTAFTIGAVATQQKEAEGHSRRAFAELESRVQARTADLAGANAAMGMEITGRKRVEEILRRSTLLLEASQATAKVGGWELDLGTKQLFWTAETYRIHDTSPEEFIPTVEAGVGFYPPESRPIVAAAVQAAMERGEGFDLVLEIRTAKGRRIDARATCSVTLHEGRPAKLTGIFQDITARTQAEEEIQKQLHELQRWQAVMLDREDRIAELKHEVNELLIRKNQPPRYSHPNAP